MNVAKVGKTGKGCGMADIEDCKYLRTEKDIDFFYKSNRSGNSLQLSCYAVA